MKRVMLWISLFMFLPAVCAIADEKKPKKVSELLKEANTRVSEAQEAYVNGETSKSIELYRKALEEIERVEVENLDRVMSADFAPLRFRKALCQTEIDRIMLEDANANARTVTVTDTAALSKKRNERKRKAETNHTEEVAVKLGAKAAEGDLSAINALVKSAKEKAVPADNAKRDLAEEVEHAKDLLSVGKTKEAREALIKVLKTAQADREARMLIAIVDLRESKPEDAAVTLDGLLDDNPQDEAVLLLSGAAAYASKQYQRAMGFLDRAMKINPKRPDGYFNMAWVLISMNENGIEESELYYRQSVKLGGERDAELEKRLGIRQK